MNTTDRIERLQAFLEQDPGDAFTRYALALEYAGAGNIHRAVSMLEFLVEHNPDYVPSYQQLGQLYRTVDRIDDARNILHRGIEAARRDGDTHARGEMQDALDEFDSL